MTKWKLMFGQYISDKPVKPGVWKRKEGGHVIRAHTTDPRTGKKKELRYILPEATATEAYATLQEKIREVKEGTKQETCEKQRFEDYAPALLEHKIAVREIRSAAT